MCEIHFDSGFNDHLGRLGISVGREIMYPIHPDVTVEPPVSLFGANIALTPVSIGAFTYFGLDSVFQSARAGRYCSFARGLQVGLAQHPSGWITTSPLPYVADFLNFERHFVDGDDGWARELPVENFDARPFTTIGNDVWIGASAWLKDGITVGDGAIIGAHAVVTKDVPPYAIVVGSPARILRYRFDDAMIERLQRLCWWDYNILEFGGWRASQTEGAVSALEDAIAAGIVAPYRPPAINLVDEYDRYLELRNYLDRMRA